MNQVRVDDALRVLLQTARQSRGLTQREAALRAGIDPSWWKKLESGRRQVTNAGTVAAMAYAAGVSPVDLDKAEWGDLASRVRLMLTQETVILDTSTAEDHLARTPGTTVREREELIFRLREMRALRSGIRVVVTRPDDEPDQEPFEREFLSDERLQASARLGWFARKRETRETVTPVLRFLTDESDTIVQWACIAATVFLVLYTAWHRWWKSTHGRTLGLMAIAVIGLCVRSVLTEWHVLGMPRLNGVDAGTWIAIQAALLLPVVFTMMVWQLVRKRMHKRSSTPAGPTAKVPDNWRVFRPSGRIGWALSPSGQWFLLEDKTIVDGPRDTSAAAQLNAWLKAGDLKPADDPLAHGSTEHGLKTE